MKTNTDLTEKICGKCWLDTGNPTCQCTLNESELESVETQAEEEQLDLF